MVDAALAIADADWGKKDSDFSKRSVGRIIRGGNIPRFEDTDTEVVVDVGKNCVAIHMELLDAKGMAIAVMPNAAGDDFEVSKATPVMDVLRQAEYLALVDETDCTDPVVARLSDFPESGWRSGRRNRCCT